MSLRSFITLEATYADGHVERFLVPAEALRNGDRVNRVLALERQVRGELTRGEITKVRRATEI